MAHASVGQAAAAPAGKAVNASSAKGAKKASTQITAPNEAPSANEAPSECNSGHNALAKLIGQLNKKSIDLSHERNEVEWKIATEIKKQRDKAGLGEALKGLFDAASFLV